MVIKFNEEILDINKVKDIVCISYQNYLPHLKFDFPSGAKGIITYQGSKKSFNGIEEFHLYVYALPYMNYLEYNFPTHFSDLEFHFIEFSKKDFLDYLEAYFDTFKELSNDNLWKCKLDIPDFICGFKFITKGTGLYLIGETVENYFSFIFQSID